MGLVEVSETFLMIYVHCENEGGNARNAYVGPHQPGEAPSLTSIFISLFIFPNKKIPWLVSLNWTRGPRARRFR